MHPTTLEEVEAGRARSVEAKRGAQEKRQGRLMRQGRLIRGARGRGGAQAWQVVGCQLSIAAEEQDDTASLTPLRKPPTLTKPLHRFIHTPPGYRSQEGPFPWL